MVIARQAAVEEVTARVGEIVLAAAERVIGREIQASDHQDLIDEAIAAVRAESDGPSRRRAPGGGPVNPALQGYLAAMEESLSADGRAGRRRLASSPRWPTSSRATPQLTLAVNDGSVPVASRRAAPRPPAGGQGPPRGRSASSTRPSRWCPPVRSPPSFHWLGSRLAQLRRPARPPARPSRTTRTSSAGMGSRNRVSGYAAAVFETVTVAELEEIEDQLFRFARTVEANRPPAVAPSATATCRSPSASR